MTFDPDALTHTYVHYTCNFFPSYDLLYEEDPDDFVAIELPSDSATVDNDSLLELTDFRRKGGFLEKLRRNRNMGGVTVITGGRRQKDGKDVAGGGEKVKALHELADTESRVMQGGKGLGGDVGAGAEDEEEVWHSAERLPHLEVCS